MPANKHKHKKDKHNKLQKLINNSSEDDDDSEHELSYYANDRIRLMKHVLKLVKPKKIKSMAPNSMKNLDIEEINSMLLEELLGISNKRLKYIFNGQHVNSDTSSSTEDENPPIDVISLDDISDDDLLIEESSQHIQSDSQVGSTKRSKQHGNVARRIKKEKSGNKKSRKESTESLQSNLSDKEKLMSVLELLELQARARAIRSQLALETVNGKEEQSSKESQVKEEDSGDSDAIVIESPKRDEIVITSSDSEVEDKRKQHKTDNEGLPNIKAPSVVHASEMQPEQNVNSEKTQKVKIIRERNTPITTMNTVQNAMEIAEAENASSSTTNKGDCVKQTHADTAKHQDLDKSTGSLTANEKQLATGDGSSVQQVRSEESENDEIIVINVDETEVEGIVND